PEQAGGRRDPSPRRARLGAHRRVRRDRVPDGRRRPQLTLIRRQPPTAVRSSGRVAGSAEYHRPATYFHCPPSVSLPLSALVKVRSGVVAVSPETTTWLRSVTMKCWVHSGFQAVAPVAPG